MFYVYGLNADLSIPIKTGALIRSAVFRLTATADLVTNARSRSARKQLQRAFPDALDLMVICVEAGMSIEAPFNKVADEMMEGRR